MKLVIVIILCSLMQVSAATFGQQLTLSGKNVTLKSVFREIKKQTGYEVIYADKTLNDQVKIDVDFKDTPLKEVLDRSLENLPVSYVIDDKGIVIKEKEPSFLDRVKAVFNSIDVHGRVLDENGQPLPGVTIRVKDGRQVTTTDKDGIFILRKVDERAVIIISFIGYLTREINAQPDLGTIALEVSHSKLDEVQVIAYGTTTQRLSTGNVTTIKADVIEKQPVNNPLLALEGRVPGLFIEQATGFAGTGIKVRIQGQNSLDNGNDPLYVVDGVPYTSQLLPGANPILGNSTGINSGSSNYGNPMSFLNPADIESIDVLKDADATAIYGSRAANGAILITTKKGKSGDLKVDLNLQTGWSKVPRKLNLMNNVQFLEMRREAMKNDGIIAPAPGPYGDNDLNGNWDTARNADWQKELIGGTAGYQDMIASVSGGSNLTTFLIGAGYHTETNVFPGDFADEKASLHFNINSNSSNQRFKLQFSGSYLQDDNRLPRVDLTMRAMTLPPVAPSLFKSDGSINWGADPSGATTFFDNPIGYIYDSYQNKTNNLISNLMLDYQIVKGLDVKTSFGYTSLQSSVIDKGTIDATPPEYLQYTQRNTNFGNYNINSWSIEPQITFNHVVYTGKLAVLLGATLIQQSENGSQITAWGFSNDLVMDDILSATNVIATASNYSLYRYGALFGRINYSFKDKYILNLTARRDGSSRFGSENQFHDFGAIGAAWIFSEEEFVKNNFNFLSFGKFKGSYGITGSDQIPDYQFLSLYSPIRQQVPYQGITVYQPQGITNPYLQWEATKKLQFGLDLGFLQDKILLNFNYYKNRSSNQLTGYTLPATAGFDFVLKNQRFVIQNSGWEFVVSSTNVKIQNFKWSSSVNITLPRTLLVAYPDLDKSSARYTAIVGKPLGAEYVYHFLGVDPANGLYQFSDHNGNPTTSPNYDTDRTVLINPFPQFYGGFQNTFSYKGVQLDVLISFTKQSSRNYFFGNSPYLGHTNQPDYLLNRWQKPGDLSATQKYTTGTNLYYSFLNAQQISDAGISDGSYVRLKNVSLSWQLPKFSKQLRHLQNFSVFIQGQNLFTITGYKGLDPESQSSTTLPPLRVITIGFKATF